MSNRRLRIVVVFGLDDGKLNFPELLEWVWNSQYVKLYPFVAGWRDGGEYPPKLQRLLDLIDKLLATGDPVAVIGISAGASLAINAYVLRPQLVGVVNVCGALRIGGSLPQKFARSVGSSAAFRVSALACEESRRRLALDQLRRVLIMLPCYDFVPLSTMRLKGAKVCRVVGINHSQSILTVMLFYRRTILRFLRQSSKPLAS